MGERVKVPDTENRRRGHSGGFIAELATDASRQTTPVPAKGEDKAGDPLGASTTHFQDDDRQQVTSKTFGSGEDGA